MLEGTKVDSLANSGRLGSSKADERTHICTVRDKILSASIHLLSQINKKIEVLNKTELNGPSDVTDDFSASANAEQEPNMLL